MQRLIDALDRVLTFVLMTLVVLMVFSISAEIVLNAFVQPLTSHLIDALSQGRPGAGPEAGGLLGLLHGLSGAVSRLSAPINTTSQTLLVWIGILGSALAFRLRAHLGVDALVRVYPPRARLILDYVSTLLVAAFALLVLVLGGTRVTYLFFKDGTTMPGLEMFNQGWFYTVLPITGALLLVYAVVHLLHPKPVGNEPEEPADAEHEAAS